MATALRRNSTLTALHLYNNKIGDSGASALATALQHNSSLTTLDLSSALLRDISIGDSGASALATALQHNSTLTALDLSSNSIGVKGVSALATALQHNSTLNTLNLHSNSIGELGASALAIPLQHNSTLTTLDIRNSRIGDSGATALATALQHNSTLTTLDLSFNSIGHALLKQMYVKLEQNKSTPKSVIAGSSEAAGPSSSTRSPALPSSLESIPSPQAFEHTLLQAEREAAAKLRAELDAMKAEKEQAVNQASEEAKRLQAEVEYLKAQQNDSPHPKETDFLSRLQIRTLDELEVEEPHFAAGAYGNVHRGKYHGQQVAIKRLNGSSELESLVKELKMWSRLLHPNIVQLMGYTEPPLPPMIVMELMEGSLFDLLQKFQTVSLNLPQRMKMAHDLASGVSYLHHHQGVHRDIKSLNVLVKGSDVKLADFGGTRSLMSLRTVTASGSIRWNAPEIHDGEQASQASDVYSMGITFSEILTRQIPYAHLKADGAVVKAVGNGIRPQLWPPTAGMQELLIDGGDLEKQTEGFRQLIQICWEENPQKRPAAREVRVELASLIRQVQQFTTLCPAVAASSSSSEPSKSPAMPLYDSKSDFIFRQ